MTPEQRTALMRHVRGVTLVELMISLVIGLLLTLGATTVYLQSRSSYQVSDATARLQEVARYALDVIEQDIRLAGYWGFINDPLNIAGNAAATDLTTSIDGSVASNCRNNWTANLANYADGLDGSGTGGSGYNLSCTAANAAVAWADVLISRHATSNTTALTNNRIQIQTSRAAGIIFSNGTMPSGYGADPLSETHDLSVNAYYVNRIAGSPDGFPMWELRRKVLNLGPAIGDESVVPGVQDLQVQFGIDTNGNGAPDQYVNPESVPTTARILTARVWILIVSDEAEDAFSDSTSYAYANVSHGTFSDRRRRLLVSKTIQLRNAVR